MYPAITREPSTESSSERMARIGAEELCEMATRLMQRRCDTCHNFFSSACWSAWSTTSSSSSPPPTQL
uniref:Uncharacterized protein n=1 Tax=Arundo donax TaxID=35708 RepID=A0A0A9AXK4_ARUDO